MSSVSSPSRGASGSCSTISWPDSVSPERVTLQQAGGVSPTCENGTNNLRWEFATFKKGGKKRDKNGIRGFAFCPCDPRTGACPRSSVSCSVRSGLRRSSTSKSNPTQLEIARGAQGQDTWNALGFWVVFFKGKTRSVRIYGKKFIPNEQNFSETLEREKCQTGQRILTQSV